MKRITILISLVFWIGIAFGQTGNPKRASTPSEQTAVIEKVRDHALSYTKELPNYICTQRTRQMIQQGTVLGQLGTSLDLIEEQISFVDNRETRRVLSLNGQPVAADGPEQQRGTPSRGEFGTILEVIFDPQTSANLKWEPPDDAGSPPGLCFFLPCSSIERIHSHRNQTKDTGALPGIGLR